MAIVMVAMGFVTTPLGLLLLRMVFGTFAGFTASATALLAIETPKEHVGKVLGTLQTGSVTGQLLGPLFGGIMAGTFGMRNSFYITGTFLLLATLVAWIGVKEATKYRKFRLTEVVGRKKLDGAGSRKQETPLVKKTLLKDIVKHAPMLVLIYISTYLVSYSLQSISPIITLYVSSMNVGKHVELIGGLVFGASALGTMLAAPLLGRLGDRVGHPIILLVSMGAMALLYIPQALANDPWTLLVVRFLAGICYGGLVPAITSILRSMTPISIQGSVHGYNSSISSLGNVCGAIFGGIISGVMGFPHLFYTIGSILFVYFLVLTFLFGRLNRAVKEQVESNH
jgi:MFS family permease